MQTPSAASSLPPPQNGSKLSGLYQCHRVHSWVRFGHSWRFSFTHAQPAVASSTAAALASALLVAVATPSTRLDRALTLASCCKSLCCKTSCCSAWACLNTLKSWRNTWTSDLGDISSSRTLTSDSSKRKPEILSLRMLSILYELSLVTNLSLVFPNWSSMCATRSASLSIWSLSELKASLLTNLSLAPLIRSFVLPKIRSSAPICRSVSHMWRKEIVCKIRNTHRKKTTIPAATLPWFSRSRNRAVKSAWASLNSCTVIVTEGRGMAAWRRAISEAP
mmetsp:Transcript_23337/g.61590  ORF Transcript_23337/g.61590 Transcript_23337/m.61590 type:complete len:278 (-) Transcript_23337:283-1116(-)